jgi:hypothetical protein
MAALLEVSTIGLETARRAVAGAERACADLFTM